MNQDDLQKLFQYRGVDPQKIPNIDVYMDQLISFFHQTFGLFRREQEETILTKSMTNNYVKAKILQKPTKKKYSIKQIKKLIMIYHLKQVLSIQDLKKLLDLLEGNEGDIDKAYSLFLAQEKEIFQELAQTYQHKLDQVGQEAPDSEVILRLASEAIARKRLAEKLLDHRGQP